MVAAASGDDGHDQIRKVFTEILQEEGSEYT